MLLIKDLEFRYIYCYYKQYGKQWQCNWHTFMWHFSRPKPLAGKQGRSSPTTKDPKQTKYRLSPNRSDGLLHVTLTAKQNIQEHQKKMRVIEVRLDVMELKMPSNFILVVLWFFWFGFVLFFCVFFLSRLVILFSLMFFGNILNKYTLFIYLFVLWLFVCFEYNSFLKHLWSKADKRRTSCFSAMM